MWEVFKPVTGQTVYLTRFETVARVVAWFRGLDYNRQGMGWIMMNRETARHYVQFVVDDCGNGRTLNDDPHAIIRETDFKYPSVLVGYCSEPAPIFVAVHSYLDVRMTDDECAELAGDYLRETGLPVSAPDFVIR